MPLGVILILLAAIFKIEAQPDGGKDDEAKAKEEMYLAAQHAIDMNNGIGPEIKAADVISSCLNTDRARSRDTLMMEEGFYLAQRARLCSQLRGIFSDKQQSNYARCAAAFYLGEMRAPEAADDLASEITLDFQIITPGSHVPSEAFMSPAFTALVKIGSAAFPALLRNLETSDDAALIRSCVKAIYAIDGKDRDLSQFRLRHAMEAQPDSRKKARLQAALQIMINDPEFRK